MEDLFFGGEGPNHGVVHSVGSRMQIEVLGTDAIMMRTQDNACLIH